MKCTRCKDKNPKTVKRVFSVFDKKLEILICKNHCKDPDFSDFISEEKLQ